MLSRDVDHIRHVCQHKLDTQLEESREALKVFFGMDEDDIEALSILLDWVSNHGLEHYLRLKERR